MGFVFYDTETTGLQAGFDQIIQFAAIHTDADLNELDRFEIKCRLLPHVAPHPTALLANRIPIEQLIDPALPSHYEMVCRVRRQLAAWSPAIFVGYNSIRFDEEMLRHAFFQCLFPAFLTSSSGNGRADAMNLVLTACAEPSPCIGLPLGSEGRPTFKLEAVAAANGLNLGSAHDAMVDAETTLELCRRIRSAAGDAWQRFVRFSNKAVVSELVQEDCFLFTQFFAGEATHRLVSCLGTDPSNPNGRLCWDLSEDPAPLNDLDDQALVEAVCRPRSPVRRLRVNAAPAIAASWEAPEEWLACDLPVCESRAAWLRENPAFRSRVIALYVGQWTDRPPSPHPEMQLYDGGFPGPSDEARMAEFHEAGRRRRLALVEDFDDPRLKAFSLRLVYSEHRSTLDEARRIAADVDLAQSLLDERGAGLTLPAALAIVDDLLAQGSADPDNLLLGYRKWLSARIAGASAFRDKAAKKLSAEPLPTR